jgi:hypothetical protein
MEIMSSEVAQLRESIELELVAMRLGLSGLAAGTAKHQFIEARMHQLGTYEDQLTTHIGREQAVLFSCQAYIRVMEGKERE